jgi:hypothetical protein
MNIPRKRIHKLNFRYSAALQWTIYSTCGWFMLVPVDVETAVQQYHCSARPLSGQQLL